MLTAKLMKSYRKSGQDGDIKRNADGSPWVGFVYQVHGSKKDIDKYIAVQTAKGVSKDSIVDGGKVLWFETNPVGETITLRIGSKGNIFADTSIIDLCASLHKQYGTVGLKLAEMILKKHFSDEPKEPADELPTDLGHVPHGATINNDEDLDDDK